MAKRVWLLQNDTIEFFVIPNYVVTRFYCSTLGVVGVVFGPIGWSIEWIFAMEADPGS
jgi:hypothetical protein